MELAHVEGGEPRQAIVQLREICPSKKIQTFSTSIRAGEVSHVLEHSDFVLAIAYGTVALFIRGARRLRFLLSHSWLLGEGGDAR